MYESSGYKVTLYFSLSFAVYLKSLKKIKPIQKEKVITVWFHLLSLIKENTVKYTHTVEYYFSLNKEGNLAICNKMDEPGGHYAKWNKPVMER